MKIAPILRRAWGIVRHNPALLALGLLVAIGAGSGAIGEWWLGLLSPRPRPGTRLADFSTAPPDPSALPLPPSLSSTGPHTWAALAGLGVSLLCALLLIALLFGVLSVLARGGIVIAAADAVADRPVRLAGALRAAWTQLWRLLVILSIPLIPATLGAIALVGVYRAQFGPGGVGTLAALAAPFADPAFRTTGAVLMVPLLAVSLALGFFQVLADRACLLEGREPLDSYWRAWAVFRAHPGPLASLLLAEMALRVGLGVVVSLLTLTVVCRFVIPLPLLLGALLRTYLGVLWTVGWARYSDMVDRRAGD